MLHSDIHNFLLPIISIHSLHLHFQKNFRVVKTYFISCTDVFKAYQFSVIRNHFWKLLSTTGYTGFVWFLGSKGFKGSTSGLTKLLFNEVNDCEMTVSERTGSKKNVSACEDEEFLDRAECGNNFHLKKHLWYSHLNFVEWIEFYGHNQYQHACERCDSV